MIKRDAEKTVRSLLDGFPIVTITGPRQSGKTTLAKSIFATRPYVSLEDPDMRRLAQEDPRSFLERFPDGAVLDEVQRCPEMFSYLQTRVDADGRMGLFILTGSQQFGLIFAITQSLAGRTAFVELLPFTLHELIPSRLPQPILDEVLYKGFYPPLYDRQLDPAAWFGAYVTAYIERDVRQVLRIHELDTFQRFVRLCAGRSGQLLNLSSLASDCGITHNTAKAWISVLEASYLIFQLRPHHGNFGKRLIKSPKIYFYDTGLMAWLLGVRNVSQLDSHPLRGSLFENFIIAELLKNSCNRGERCSIYFWRDSNGVEVDLLLETGQKLIPIEIKSGKTVARQFFAGLEKWAALAGKVAGEPFLIYGGDESFRHLDVSVQSWRDVAVEQLFRLYP